MTTPPVLCRPLRITCLALAVLAATVPVWAQGWPGIRRADAGVHRVDTTDRLVVHYKDAATTTAPTDTHLQQAHSAGSQLGLTLSHRRRLGTGADVFQISRKLGKRDLQTLMDEMKRQDASIDSIEPDVRVFALGTRTADPYLAKQWNLWDFDSSIWAPYAWSYSRGAGVVVAIVDSGVWPHPDLQPNLLAGYDFIGDTANTHDGDGRDADASDPGDWSDAGECGASAGASASSWHGTHVAGIAAAAGYNALGVTGVAYNAKILPVRVLGDCGGYSSDIADAITWSAGGTVLGVPANTTPARVINLSLGGVATCPSVMQTAINKARSLGAVVVVAAGNDGGDAAASMPANCTGVIAVAATNRAGDRAGYSNFGSNVTVAAPGGDWSDGIWSTLNDGATVPGNAIYAQYYGTSMATPHVSGTVALMLFANKNLVPDQVSTILQNSSSFFLGSCDGCGAGLVNALDAVQAALDASWNEVTLAEVEPNNTLGTAQAIPTTPTVVNGSLSSNTDVDYYRVSVAAGAKVVGTLSAAAASNFDLYAYDAYGRQLAAGVNGAGVNDVVTVSNTASTMTTVYLRVVRNTGSAGSYTLSVANN